MVDVLFYFIIAIITYASLGYCYFHFIVLCVTAIRIRILQEIFENEIGLTDKEILKIYDAESMIEMRIKRLEKNGQVVYKSGRYYLNSITMLIIAKIITTMRVIVIGKRLYHNQ